MRKINVLVAIPIYKRELLALNCIRSLIDVTEPDERIILKIALGINEMNSDLEQFVTHQRDNANKFQIVVYDFKSNLGKARAINKVASLEKYKFDFIVSMDSDMICIDPKWLSKMITVYINYNKRPDIISSRGHVKLGSLCVNQMGYNVHLTHANPLKVKIGGYTIISAPGNYGIAGGVLMSDVETWNQLKGYKASKIYGSDDGHYNGDCATYNKLAGYLNEVSFYHPYEFNDEYRKWKTEIIAQQDETAMNTLFVKRDDHEALTFANRIREVGLDIKIRESDMNDLYQFVDDSNVVYQNNEAFQKVDSMIPNSNNVFTPKGRIIILWATTRPDMFKSTHKVWMDNARCKYKIYTRVAVDTQEVADKLNGFDVIVTNNTIHGVCYPSYCLSATTEAHDDDIIIFASDDFYPPNNWDSYIASHMNEEKHKVLVVNDGIQKYPNKVITLPIMHYSALKQMNNIIYHPVYTHMYSDIELYTTTEKMGLLKDIRNISSVIFEHRHHSVNLRAIDVSDTNLNSSYKIDGNLNKTRCNMNIIELLDVNKSIKSKLNSVIKCNKINKIDLSILVCTTPTRKDLFNRFINAITSQLNYKVELLVESDDGSMTIGHKRNILLDKAKGNYICYFDDDDLPSDDYVEKILTAIKSDPDCCSLEGLYTVNGENPTLFRHSLDYKQWETVNENGETIYHRSPNHLNAIKRTLASKVRFNDSLSNGEDKDFSCRLLPYLKTESKINGIIYNYLFLNVKKGYM